MVLTQQAEVLLDLVMAVIGGGLGWSHAGRIVCRTPGVTLESVHRYAKKAVTGIAVALGTVLVLSLAGIIRSIAWMFPLTFELLYPYLKWGVLSFVFMYVGALSWRVARHSRHRERGKLTFALVLLTLALFILRWKMNFPIPLDSYEAQKAGEVILQTTGASCVPATVANILGTFGVEESERSMAAEMGTTIRGTTHGRVALVLWQRGFECRRVTASKIADVVPPAALTVDHAATGPESHMVGFMGMVGDAAEIWDPLFGQVLMSPEELAITWHGKALEVYRP